MLTEKREKVLKKMPQIENKVELSQDGKFLIHKTVITHVKPVAYYEKVFSNAAAKAEV